jgi:UDPglucose 6-dehydrogenase
VVIGALLRAGARVAAHDPIAVEETRRVLALDFADAPALLGNIRYCLPKDPMSALEDADALVIVTEWKAYRSPNLVKLKALMKSPVIFDGRNLYEPATMRNAGIAYQGIGRNSR